MSEVAARLEALEDFRERHEELHVYEDRRKFTMLVWVLTTAVSLFGMLTGAMIWTGVQSERLNNTVQDTKMLSELVERNDDRGRQIMLQLREIQTILELDDGQ